MICVDICGMLYSREAAEARKKLEAARKLVAMHSGVSSIT